MATGQDSDATVMATLTTRQRDLLQILLEADNPLGASDLAVQMKLTPRQVNYGLKGLQGWLAQRDVDLRITPGVGAALDCSPEQSGRLARELAAEANFQLVLTAEERQQLLALVLLAAGEPHILYQLQRLAKVSRTTVLRDLDYLDAWLKQFGLRLERRPNFGVMIQGTELARRQGLGALVWGDTPFGSPLTELSHSEGLVFNLGADADLLPLVKGAGRIIGCWEIARTFGLVAHAETQLGGRFTDDGVLHLALMLAIQADRVQKGRTVVMEEATISRLQSQAVWPVAEQVAARLSWRRPAVWPTAELAAVAMQILATPRNERWPGDLDVDGDFKALLDLLMHGVADAYRIPELAQDMTLRDGLVTHVIPACWRQRFQLWGPAPLPTTSLPERYAFEHELAHELATLIERQTATRLPDVEVKSLTMLLRAAIIRERPYRAQEVLVVCPSGMATAQLLVARLKARFPRLGNLRIVSQRELNAQRTARADLIITTAPLPKHLRGDTTVIQVHPLLLPEDVEAITQWLA